MTQTSDSDDLHAIRVLLVDDDSMVREGLAALLERMPDLRVVGEAADGRAAVKLARSTTPHIVSMNVMMPGLNGVDATRQITSVTPSVKVLGVSHRKDPRVVTEMRAAGATGYVLKSATFAEYVDALRAVAQGRTYWGTSVAEPLARDYVGSYATGRGPLSAREREVLQLIAEGLPTSKVAKQLHISTKTVDTHRRQIMEKLGKHSIAELTKYAIREGLTTLA